MKSVVLLSGGLDSVVNLYQASIEGNVLLALTFDYGQRAAIKEIEAASFFAKKLNIPHKVISLSWFKEFIRSSLINHTLKVPTGDEVSIESHQQSVKTASAVWVPNRNGIFLNIAAGFAESLEAQWVVPGFNIEEASTFPDNSEDFINSLSQSFIFSTSNKVKVHCFTTRLNKSEIVRIGKTLQVPFNHLWPCYFAGETWCGECESCLRIKRALLS